MEIVNGGQCQCRRPVTILRARATLGYHAKLTGPGVGLGLLATTL